jgi:hypothetical protein
MEKRFLTFVRKDAGFVGVGGKKGGGEAALFFILPPYDGARLFEPQVRNLPFYVQVSLYGALNA